MMRILSDEGDYKTKAYDFTIADDLYMFFKFKSPKSRCEIGIAYDQIATGGDWYVHDGNLGGCDYEIVTDIVFDRLWGEPEFVEFYETVQAAASKFNRAVR